MKSVVNTFEIIIDRLDRHIFFSNSDMYIGTYEYHYDI